MMKKIQWFLMSLGLVLLVACSTSQSSSLEPKKDLKSIDFILDWTPNTNHTGLYVAKEKGYFSESGYDVQFKLPPEDSGLDLVINQQAPFTISFQDAMTKRLEKNAPITAVAAIVSHNTSGIISKKDLNIVSPQFLKDKTYGTWQDPIELAMIKTIMEKEGVSFDSVKLVQNTDANAIAALTNGQFQAAWVFYGWDGILAEKTLPTNFFYLKDVAPELDYYTPVIVSNNEFIKNNKEDVTKIIQAIKKGYQYVMANPEESAEILMKHAPELSSNRDFILASQKYLSKAYAESAESWGIFEESRWNAFFDWAEKNAVLEKAIPKNTGFTNEFLK